METYQSPFMSDAIDVLLHVGSDYTVPAMLREYKTWGASKRVSSTGLPIEKIIPGVSRMFLWHSEAIPVVKAAGKTMRDLTQKLVEMGLLNEIDAVVFELTEPWEPAEVLLPDSYVPSHILRLTCIIQDQKPDVRREIQNEFDIRWQGGVVAFTYLGRLEYVVPDGGVPKNIEDTYGDSIDYVSVTYDRTWENKPDND